MESNPNLQQLLEQLERSNRKQLRCARIQCIFTVAAAVFCLLLLVTATRIVPQVQELAGRISDITAQAEVVLNNLEVVTEQLAQADIAGMVSDVDTLVSGSQQGVEQALEKINAIDITTLNKAIQDLSSIVAPLAKLIGRFG